MYLLLFIIPILFVIMAQTLVNSSYSKYLNMLSKKGYSGEMVARILLERKRLDEVDVSLSDRGRMSDYYDPRLKSVRLSNDVYYGNSISSVAIAAHEVGHALQDADNYGFLSVRNRMLPYVSFASQFGWISIIFGILFTASSFINLGIIMLIVMALFQIITLPIELNASNRALRMLCENNIIVDEEQEAVENMLRAAAFTYIASLVSSIAYILRLILISNRRSN
ncbi:MAG: zinc metallopeptidase [Erysipelotrichia bacterium]|nr:zinc metallopeptidase [Erysipelotrichia bacterium]NCC54878.1 zinc metallopeptidase [Erysipelotrichia bacterium]